MKKGTLTALILTFFLLVTSIPVLAETVGSKYDMRLYGRVKVDLNYDTAEFAKYNDWLGAVKENGTNDSVNFNPRDTRFGLEASHTDGDLTAKGRFEIDFYGTNVGNNLIPRMRLGYVDLANSSTGTSLRVGQDWIPVAQQNPATIDFGILSAAGNLWWRIPQVTLRQQLGDVELLVSAMNHRRTDTASEARMPWVLGRVAYNMGGGNLIALGGGYTTVEYSATQDIDRSMAALELKLNLGPVLLKGEGFWGKGIDDEFLRYDMGVNTSDPNNIKEIEALGGFISLTAKATEKLSVSAGYGIDDPKDDDMKGMGTLGDRQFTQNAIAFVNGWYKVTKGVKVGAEIMHVTTERFGNTDEGMRYTLSTFYSF